MQAQRKIWCDEDEHRLYEYYADFNEWLDGDDGLTLREQYGIDGLNQPSKAFYTGDKEAYEEAFRQYRIDRRHEALSLAWLEEQFGGNHWAQRNHDRFEQLIERMASAQVVPFIGAGISASARFPSWREHLREQARTAGLPTNHVEELLTAGRYEGVIEQIEQQRCVDVFVQEIQDVFSRTHAIPDVVWRISELFRDTVITTNYDRLLEQAYDTGEPGAFQVLNATAAMERVKPKAVTIYKLHGDVKQPARCILGKRQYDEAYGKYTLDLSRPIPKLLSYHYKNNSLLFLGSSLNEDRTVQVFRAIKQTLGDQDVPQHFSIEQAPESEQELVERNAYLKALGITAIWFETGRFECVEALLRQAKNELSYLGALPGLVHAAMPSSQTPQSIEADFSVYLRDFVDLMPLLHWFRRAVPQQATRKYLNAMQRVFHAQSIFTDDIDAQLLEGLDNLLRAIANNAQFDGYSQGKLTVAFASFQQFLDMQGQDNHANEQLALTMQEMLTITAGQLQELPIDGGAISESDRHAVRVAIALLHHGRNQLHTPQHYCELPETLNPEVSDFLAFALTAKLGVVVPDRLDPMLNDDIRQLCEIAWTNFDREARFGFLQRVNALLKRFR